MLLIEDTISGFNAFLYNFSTGNTLLKAFYTLKETLENFIFHRVFYNPNTNYE